MNAARMRAKARGRGGAGRLCAWLVTGPVGRGLSFAIDFALALRTAVARRRGQRGPDRFV